MTYAFPAERTTAESAPRRRSLYMPSGFSNSLSMIALYMPIQPSSKTPMIAFSERNWSAIARPSRTSSDDVSSGGRTSDDFGLDAVGIHYQQGLKDVVPASGGCRRGTPQKR